MGNLCVAEKCDAGTQTDDLQKEDVDMYISRNKEESTIMGIKLDRSAEIT